MLTRGRALDALLVAMATLVATWPLSTLLESPTWFTDVLVMVLVVAAAGVVGRGLALRGWQVLALQVVVVVLTVANIYGRGHLWYGLPTLDTLVEFNRLLLDAISTIQTYTAPAPTTDSLRMLIGTSLGLMAVLVDYLALTRRSPSAAGLPLLGIFLISAANSGSSLHPLYFVLAAAAWLVIVARQGALTVRRWGTRVPQPLTPVRDIGEDSAVSGYNRVARSLGVGALVIAVALPIALPHLPTRFILDGLGRNDGGVGGRGTVGFSQSLDLSADLTNRNTSPVLQYRTNDPSPPPLRVSVSSRYARGLWPGTGENNGDVVASVNPEIPTPSGLTRDVPVKKFELVATSNRLAAPNLAVPYPLVTADLDGAVWGVERRTQQALVTQRPVHYSVDYLQVTPTAAQLRGGLAEVGQQPTLFDTQVDPFSAETVTARAAEVTAGKSNPYDQAMAIQQYLRQDGGFLYSLTLIPEEDGTRGTDPLTNFLNTKQGYCVQFATAMIMMARSLGIPARMAKGFLPGVARDGVRTVTAADAHAWPELYFAGVGWTRFEPTPAVRTGAAPPYATPSVQNEAPAGGRQLGDDETATPTPAPEVNREDLLDDSQVPLGGVETSTPLVDRLFTGWALVGWAALLGLLGAFVVPLASRWRRRNGLAAARTDNDYVEAQWTALSSQLRDLGMPPGAAATPRQLRTYYEKGAFLDTESTQALGRVVNTLERTRYAPPRTDPDPDSRPTIEPDGTAVVKAVARTRARSVRVRALLWPSSGRQQLSQVWRGLVWSVQEPLRDVGARWSQWRAARRSGKS